MADFDEIWGAVPERGTLRLETPIGTIRWLGRLWQHMVSGDIAAAAGSAGVDAAGVGALGLATGDAYSVRLARDRLLIVSGGGEGVAPGWHDAGYAVSDMSALDVIEIDGELADAIVGRATTLPLSGTGPSAAVAFAGVDAYVYRHGEAAALRVHVDPTLSPYLWTWFNAVAAGLPLSPTSGPSGSIRP